MWDVKLKFRHRQQYGGTRGKGVRVVKGEGAQYIVTEDDFTLGGGHTMYSMYRENVHLEPT